MSYRSLNMNLRKVYESKAKRWVVEIVHRRAMCNRSTIRGGVCGSGYYTDKTRNNKFVSEFIQENFHEIVNIKVPVDKVIFLCRKTLAIDVVSKTLMGILFCVLIIVFRIITILQILRFVV